MDNQKNPKTDSPVLSNLGEDSGQSQANLAGEAKISSQQRKATFAPKVYDTGDH